MAQVMSSTNYYQSPASIEAPVPDSWEDALEGLDQLDENPTSVAETACTPDLSTKEDSFGGVAASAVEASGLDTFQLASHAHSEAKTEIVVDFDAPASIMNWADEDEDDWVAPTLMFARNVGSQDDSPVFTNEIDDDDADDNSISDLAPAMRVEDLTRWTGMANFYQKMYHHNADPNGSFRPSATSISQEEDEPEFTITPMHRLPLKETSTSSRLITQKPLYIKNDPQDAEYCSMMDNWRYETQKFPQHAAQIREELCTAVGVEDKRLFNLVDEASTPELLGTPAAAVWTQMKPFTNDNVHLLNFVKQQYGEDTFTADLEEHYLADDAETVAQAWLSHLHISRNLLNEERRNLGLSELEQPYDPASMASEDFISEACAFDDNAQVTSTSSEDQLSDEDAWHGLDVEKSTNDAAAAPADIEELDGECDSRSETWSDASTLVEAAATNKTVKDSCEDSEVEKSTDDAAATPAGIEELYSGCDSRSETWSDASTLVETAATDQTVKDSSVAKVEDWVSADYPGGAKNKALPRLTDEVHLFSWANNWQYRAFLDALEEQVAGDSASGATGHQDICQSQKALLNDVLDGVQISVESKASGQGASNLEATRTDSPSSTLRAVSCANMPTVDLELTEFEEEVTTNMASVSQVSAPVPLRKGKWKKCLKSCNKALSFFKR